MKRRALMLAGGGVPWLARAADDAVRRGRAIEFPHDHGAHLSQRIEWWYLTGALTLHDGSGSFGFQVTFFRLRTGLGMGLSSRFAARHLLFAHAAVTLPQSGWHLHEERIARWSGDPSPAATARAALGDADVRLAGWRLQRRGDGAIWTTRAQGRRFVIDLELTPSQVALLQGDAGFSRKGPLESQASHYYSLPQLQARGRIAAEGRSLDVSGVAWLDHEWADELLAPQAVGWDWIGFNLADGSALTAFRLRATDSAAAPVWAGGSFRAADGAVRNFGPGEVVFVPVRRWRSPATNAEYPVHWRVSTPAGHFEVRSLLDAQELGASGQATGTVYWEGLSELLDEAGRRAGIGYLEMTGYVGRLRV